MMSSFVICCGCCVDYGAAIGSDETNSNDNEQANIDSSRRRLLCTGGNALYGQQKEQKLRRPKREACYCRERSESVVSSTKNVRPAARSSLLNDHDDDDSDGKVHYRDYDLLTLVAARKLHCSQRSAKARSSAPSSATPSERRLCHHLAAAVSVRGSSVRSSRAVAAPGSVIALLLLGCSSLFVVGLLSSSFASGAVAAAAAETPEDEARAGGHWSLPNRPSLFSIVRFPNEECFDSSNQSGTCYTAFECKLLGGQPSSPCAAGFGSCCIVSRTCHVTTREKVVYFKNPSYPSTDSDEKVCDLTVEMGDINVCQVRLDFLDFQLDSPTNGACLQDYMEISASGMPPQTVPRLCGLNRNQHRKYQQHCPSEACESGADASSGIKLLPASTVVAVVVVVVQCAQAHAQQLNCIEVRCSRK